MQKAPLVLFSPKTLATANRRITSSVSNIAGNFPVDTFRGAIATPSRFPLHSLAAISLPDPEAAERFTVPKISMDTDPRRLISKSHCSTDHLAIYRRSRSSYWTGRSSSRLKAGFRIGAANAVDGGASDGLTKCMITFVKEGRCHLDGCEYILGIGDLVLPFGVRVEPVELNEHGLSPAKRLASWVAGLRAHHRTRRDVLCEVLAEGREISTKADEKDDGAAEEKEGEVEGEEITDAQALTTLWASASQTADAGLELRPLASAPHHLSPKQIIPRLWNYLFSKYSLIAIPGYLFNAAPHVKSAHDFIRLTLAAASPEQLRVAVELFVEGIRHSRRAEG
ncbi:hypothetical protein PSPO01_07241 [Paraphaeosphaeria sporulosa]